MRLWDLTWNLKTEKVIIWEVREGKYCFRKRKEQVRRLEDRHSMAGAERGPENVGTWHETEPEGNSAAPVLWDVLTYLSIPSGTGGSERFSKGSLVVLKYHVDITAYKEQTGGGWLWLKRHTLGAFCSGPGEKRRRPILSIWVTEGVMSQKPWPIEQRSRFNNSSKTALSLDMSMVLHMTISRVNLFH